MDFTLTYCPTRHGLENASWKLVSKLASATGELLRLMGQNNHQVFATAKQECSDLRELIDASRVELRQHRSVHGC